MQDIPPAEEEPRTLSDEEWLEQKRIFEKIDQEVLQLMPDLHTTIETESDDLIKNVRPIHDFSDEYDEYVNSSEGVNLGIPELDAKIRKVRPGQVLMLMGFSGNFKSAVLQRWMLHYLTYSPLPVVMFQLEMSGLDLFERAIQMQEGMEGKVVEEIFKDKEMLTSKFELVERIRRKQKNFYVVDLPGLSWHIIGEHVRAMKQEWGITPGMVGVDYVQLMTGKGGSYKEIMDAVAKGMKVFARSYEVPLFIVSQVTGLEGPYDEVNLMQARDSKTLIHASDYVVGIWKVRHGEADRQKFALLKCRKGGLITVERELDKKSLSFKIKPF